VDFLETKVLVIEDQEMIRDIVVSTLRAIGFRRIRTAGDGQAGLRAVMDDRPEIILCDITMDRMDGFQFVEAMLRAGYSGEKRIPTVFLTAHATAEFVARAKQLQIDSYVIKPVKKDVLEARIKHVLSHRPVSA